MPSHYTPRAVQKCAAPYCQEPRLRRNKHTFYAFCAAHQQEAAAQQQRDATARNLPGCTLAQLPNRWSKYPYGAPAFYNGKQIFGLGWQDDMHLLSVVLAGCDEPLLLPADTRVELRRNGHAEPMESEL